MINKNTPILNNNLIDPQAKEIVTCLQNNGFDAYLVGGCVRDLLVGLHPKDFDIATEAYPNQIRKIIPQSYIIGKRFRLVLVQRLDKQFEVSTFRRNATEEDLNNEKIVGDNFFGTPKEDALRRDFTVNGIFYNPVSKELIDYCGGIDDLKSRTIRMIGDPTKRLTEDPIRILRALRLSHKLNFKLDPKLREAMLNSAHELQKSVLPRRREEILKFLRLNNVDRAYLEAYDLDIWKHITPTINKIMNNSLWIDDFLSYLKRIQQFTIIAGKKDDSAVIFSFLIFTYWKIAENPNDDNLRRYTQFIENSNLDQFFKSELGIFNSEKTFITRILRLQSSLVKSKNTQTIPGEKKHTMLLKHGLLSFALNFAIEDYSLNGEQIQFWQSYLKQQKKHIDTIANTNENNKLQTSYKTRTKNKSNKTNSNKK